MCKGFGRGILCELTAVALLSKGLILEMLCFALWSTFYCTITPNAGMLARVMTKLVHEQADWFTESGSIVVSDALVSSYAAVRSYSLVNQHLEAHALFAVRRLVCAFDFSICKSETCTDGFPSWLSSVVYFAKSTTQNALAQLLASAVVLPFITFAYILEQMILYPLFLGMFMLGLFAFKKKTMMCHSRGARFSFISPLNWVGCLLTFELLSSKLAYICCAETCNIFALYF